VTNDTKPAASRTDPVASPVTALTATPRDRATGIAATATRVTKAATADQRDPGGGQVTPAAEREHERPETGDGELAADHKAAPPAPLRDTIEQMASDAIVSTRLG
jgi:hypothetical protein